MNKVQANFGISKSQTNDDGTLTIEGYCSAHCVDSDGQTITADAMRRAIPRYLAESGAVREMHSNIAAGVAIDAYVEDDGRTFFSCLVVDSSSIKKVRKGVLKMFSIGGDILATDPNDPDTITDLILKEISLVDVGANPKARFTLFKADGIVNVDNHPNINTINDMTADNNKNNEVIPAKETTEEVVIDAVVPPVVTPEAVEVAVVEPVAPVVDVVVEPVIEVPAVVVEPVVEVVEPAPIAKAGSRNSQSDQAKLQTILSLLIDLGVELPGDTVDVTLKSQSEATLQKFNVANDLNKALETKLNKALGENTALTKRVKELEDMPAAPKAVLGAVNKAMDSVAVEDQAVTPELVTVNGQVNAQASAMKMMLMAQGFGKQ